MRSQYDALIRETGAFSDAFATTDINGRIDGRRMEGSLVTGNFFHVLGVSAARGRTLTPSDDEHGGGRAIVLSHRAFSRTSASDPAVTRTVLLNGAPFQVVGVMPEGFRGLTVAAPDFWAPLSLVRHFRRVDAGREGSVGIEHRRAAEARAVARTGARELRVWDSQRAAEDSVERPATNLASNQGRVPSRCRPTSCCCSRRSFLRSASS